MLRQMPPDSLIATARLLRRQSVQNILCALRWCPLSRPELIRVLHGLVAASTVQATCGLLRLAGLVRQTERYQRTPGGGSAKVWEAVT
jgi:hypothetical protein